MVPQRNRRIYSEQRFIAPFEAASNELTPMHIVLKYNLLGSHRSVLTAGRRALHVLVSFIPFGQNGCVFFSRK